MKYIFQRFATISGLLIVGVLLLLFSCKSKGDIKPYDVNKISDLYSSYVVFDSGSYWVYKKETAIANNIDTVRIKSVIKDRRFNIDQSGAPGFYYDAIEMYFKSTYTGLEKGEVTAGQPYGNSTMNENYRIYFNSGRYFRIFIPKYPLGEVQLLGINEGNYTNVEILPEFWINDNKFIDVYHTSIKDYQQSNDTINLDFYIAKNHGLVKYTRIQKINEINVINDVWTLQSFSLRQETK